MKAGEFYLNVGLKGTKESSSGLKELRDGMGGLRAMSLETKVAIVAAVYALQSMMSQSARAGLGFSLFSSYTGKSTKELQQWTYAAKQVGIEAEQMTSTASGLTDMFGKRNFLGEVPEGYAKLSEGVSGGLDNVNDPFVFMDKVIEYLKNSRDPINIQNQVLGTFPGLTPQLIGAMRDGKLDSRLREKAPHYDPGQIKGLSKVYAEWQKFEYGIEMAFGRFTAKHGLQFIEGINKVTPAIIKLMESVIHLAEQAKAFELITAFFNKTANAINRVTDHPGDVAKDVAWNALFPQGALLKQVATSSYEALRKDGLMAGAARRLMNQVTVAPAVSLTVNAMTNEPHDIAIAASAALTGVLTAVYYQGKNPGEH